MQPLALAQHICADYRRYIETTFPILDDSLRRQIDEKITSEYLLWKGPYVSLSRPFARSASVTDLAREGVLLPATASIFPGWTLYDHQEQAVRRIQRHGRGEPHAPVGELQQGRRIGLRLGLGGDQAGDQGHGVRRLLPHEQSRPAPRRIHGMELAHPPLGGDQGEGARRIF